MKTLPGVPLLVNQVTVWDLREFVLLAILSVCYLPADRRKNPTEKLFLGEHLTQDYRR